MATVYHVLGIGAEAELTDSVGRPVKVLADGKPIRELIGAWRVDVASFAGFCRKRD